MYILEYIAKMQVEILLVYDCLFISLNGPELLLWLFQH